MPDLNIERLTLRLSGLSEGDGRHLARLIADRLAEASLPEGTRGRDAMRSNIQAGSGSGLPELADQVVADLVRQLTRTA